MRIAAVFVCVGLFATAGCGPEDSEKPPAPHVVVDGPPAPAGTIDGSGLYNRNCSSCHGPLGKGNGPAGVALSPRPKDLTSQEVKEMSDSEIAKRIANGKPGTAMPAWKGMLTESEIQAIVAHIRKLQKK